MSSYTWENCSRNVIKWICGSRIFCDTSIVKIRFERGEQRGRTVGRSGRRACGRGNQQGRRRAWPPTRAGDRRRRQWRSGRAESIRFPGFPEESRRSDHHGDQLQRGSNSAL